MLAGLEFIAVLASTVFAGAAVYISLVEHPARMGRSTDLALAEWVPSYERATLMQAPLAVVSFLCGAAAWWLGAGVPWLVAAIVIVSVVPFTLVVMGPRVNRKLIAAAADEPRRADVHDLLVEWGRLHAARSMLALVASSIFLWQLVSAA